MFENLNRNPSQQEIRKFAFTLLIGMPMVGLVWMGIIWLTANVINYWVLGAFALVGIFVGGLSLIFHGAGKTAYVIWHSLAAIIEWLITLISTLIMYYLTLAPIGVIMKLFGRKPLPVQYDKSRKSYWKDCKEEPDLKRYFRQY